MDVEDQLLERMMPWMPVLLSIDLRYSKPLSSASTYDKDDSALLDHHMDLSISVWLSCWKY